MRPLALLLLTLALAGSCRTAPVRTAPVRTAPVAPVPPATASMDAPLRRHLATVGPGDLVDVLIGVGRAGDDAVRRGLGAAGVDVRVVSGGVAVGRGVRAAIERAAALPFVDRIELSQDSSPTTGRP